jgi:hypothetical protein
MNSIVHNLHSTAKVSETKENDCVDTRTGGSLEEYFSNRGQSDRFCCMRGTASKSMNTLKNLGAPHGLASNISKPDLVGLIEGFSTGGIVRI